MSQSLQRLMLGAVLATFAAASPAQVVMLAETTWGPNPSTGIFPMGAFDEQVVPAGVAPSPPVGAIPPCVPVVGVGPPGLCGATLWHSEVDCCAAGAGFVAPMTAPVAAYNSGPAAYNYATGAANRGAIASVGIAGAPLRPLTATDIVLSFDEIRSTEPGPGNFNSFDKGFVEVRSAPCGEPPCPDPAGAAPWSIVAQVVGLQGCAGPVTCTIGPGDPLLDAAFIGSSGKIRFRFDTVDGLSNTYCGWMVDNVLLTNEKCNPSCGPGVVSPRVGSTGGMPRPGNPAYAVTLSGAPPGSPAILVMGLGRLDPPLPVAALGVPSPCNLCCTPDIFLATVITDAAGGAALPVLIPPAIPPCVGPFCFQWGIFSAAGILTSSKGDVSVQP